MKLYEYVIRRLILMIFVLLGVSVVVFYFARGFPAAFDPVAPYITVRMDAAQIAEVRRIHGFDQPLAIQYFFWLRNVLNGDWGLAGIWAQGKPVSKVFFDSFPYTVE